MTRLLRTAAIGLAAVPFVLSGCGSEVGGDDDSATTTAAPAPTTTTAPGAEFSAAIDQLCAAGDDAATEAADEFEAALTDLQAATQSGDEAAYTTALDEAETATEDIIDALETFDAAVGELEVPTEFRQPLASYLDALGTQLALAEDLRLAIVNDDGAAFNQAVDQIQQADEATRAARLDAATEMNAPECAPDDDDDATAPEGTGTTTDAAGGK